MPSWRTCIDTGRRVRRRRESCPRCARSVDICGAEGWIDADPAALAASPKRERKIPAHLSIDEMERLLEMPDISDSLGCRDRAILELFYASGLRLSELVASTSRM